MVEYDFGHNKRIFLKFRNNRYLDNKSLIMRGQVLRKKMKNL